MIIYLLNAMRDHGPTTDATSWVPLAVYVGCVVLLVVVGMWVGRKAP